MGKGAWGEEREEERGCPMRQELEQLEGERVRSREPHCWGRLLLGLAGDSLQRMTGRRGCTGAVVAAAAMLL